MLQSRFTVFVRWPSSISAIGRLRLFEAVDEVRRMPERLKDDSDISGRVSVVW
ncbi:MAG TPA: hypothetical protein VKB88_14545 [Bryobacteraceae bacterium]|nr:hypothetical protein [Bryobacteraceae bacterium]